MKITKLILFSITVLLFSCSKEEAPLPTIDGMLGSWEMTGLDYKGSSTTTVLGVTAKADFTGTGKDINLTSLFKKDPNTVTSQGSYTVVLKTTTGGQTSTQDVPFDEVLIDGNWTLSGRILTVTNSGDSQTATILEQTATALKLKLDVAESETAQGITVATNIQILYTFKKK